MISRMNEGRKTMERRNRSETLHKTQIRSEGVRAGLVRSWVRIGSLDTHFGLENWAHVIGRKTRWEIKRLDFDFLLHFYFVLFLL